MSASRKRERDSDDEGPETSSARHSASTTGLMQSTDAVLEGSLDRLRSLHGSSGKASQKVPRWAYAELARQLESKVIFLQALRDFHRQVGGTGHTALQAVGTDGLVRSPGVPPIDLHALFTAVVAAGGAAQLKGDPDWRRIAFVPGVIAASRAALADVSGLPGLVRRTWQQLLAGFELVMTLRVAATKKQAKGVEAKEAKEAVVASVAE